MELLKIEDLVLSEMSNVLLDNLSVEQRQIIEAKHPLGFGNLEDIANSCIYLLSSASKWVTGTNLIIDGGYCAK